MQTWFPILVLMASIGLTYVFCIRPMHRGQRDPAAGTTGKTDPAGRREEMDRLREEIARARQDLGLGSNAADTEPTQRGNQPTDPGSQRLRRTGYYHP